MLLKSSLIELKPHNKISDELEVPIIRFKSNPADPPTKSQLLSKICIYISFDINKIPKILRYVQYPILLSYRSLSVSENEIKLNESE